MTEIADAAGWPARSAATDCTTAIAALNQLLENRTTHDLERVLLETSFATLTGTGNLIHALHDLEHHTLDAMSAEIERLVAEVNHGNA